MKKYIVVPTTDPRWKGLWEITISPRHIFYAESNSPTVIKSLYVKGCKGKFHPRGGYAPVVEASP